MRAFVRWFAALLGGVLVGAGLTLHGQVALARHADQQVENTFVLWRWIGQATFYFQGGETRMALAMHEIPDGALDESDRAAWVLIILGALFALTGPLVRRSEAGPARKPPSKPKPQPKPRPKRVR